MRRRIDAGDDGPVEPGGQPFGLSREGSIRGLTAVATRHHPHRAVRVLHPVADDADNLTVNPHGGLVACEDGDGLNHLVLVAPDGSRAFLALNRNDSEFAGANFSPDGRTLFANSQDPGVVFAIAGPWRRS